MLESERVLTIVAFILIIMAISLHYAVAARGHIWYDSLVSNPFVTNYSDKKFDQYLAFIVTASTALAIIIFLLLVDMFRELFRFRNRFVMIVTSLVLAFSLAVIISLLASVSSIEKEQLGAGYYNLQIYNGLAIADAVVAWVVEVVPLAIIFFFNIDKFTSHGPQSTNTVARRQ